MKKIGVILIAIAFAASIVIVYDAPAWGQWFGPSGSTTTEPEEEFVPEDKGSMKAEIKRLKEELKGMSKEEKEAKKAELKESSQYWKMVIKEMEKQEKQ